MYVCARDDVLVGRPSCPAEKGGHLQTLPQLSSPHTPLDWGYITCRLIPTGKLEPLVARLMGATTATRVGDGADCLFLGGSAGGLEDIECPDKPDAVNMGSLEQW